VIDNDGLNLENVELDAEVSIGVDGIPRASGHSALLVGWAVGARSEGGGRFRGVAPDTSVRFYCIPKAADDILSLPLAIARAVDDGADILVCATYVEGQTSPLLDDALEFARHVGRDGKGAAVVLPAGREMSSAPGSVHSSLSLGMADPASDPRVFCVGPSARAGDWFLWRDRRGKLRPFANRGPAIRWLAPGDDMANPFFADDRPGHAESSGAAGIAAGVLALVFACNPDLTIAEADALLRQTCVPVDPSRQVGDEGLADQSDLLPMGTDADGHNAKHGYGRIDATRACLSSSDPIAFALISLGESDAALRYARNQQESRGGRPFSAALGRWIVKAMLSDAGLAHACRSLTRACRLRAALPESGHTEAPGYLLRQLGVLVRLLLGAEPSAGVLAELIDLDGRILRAQESSSASTVDSALVAFAMRTMASTDEAQPARQTGPRLGTTDHFPLVDEKGFARDASGSRSP
jgi:hypothetical protein